MFNHSYLVDSMYLADVFDMTVRDVCCKQQQHSFVLSCFSVFQVTPSTVSVGTIEAGRMYPVKIYVANVGTKPARFRIDLQKHFQEGQEGSVES